jgi:hypothetical protein
MMSDPVLDDLKETLQHAVQENTPLVALRRKVLAEALKVVARLERENTHLRGIVAAGPVCAYGHRLPDGICNLGYPGCACEDDLAALVEAYHDEREPWRRDDDDHPSPVCVPHEEMGLYESDDGGRLWYFRCTHWRPIGDPRPPAPRQESHPDDESSPF